MSRESLIQKAQARALQGMRDTCTIRRVTGRATDEFSGVETPAYLSPNPYEGPCRFQQTSGAAAGSQDVGEDYLLLLRREVQLPMSVTGLRVNDEITVLTSQDPDLVGRVFLIRDLFGKTDASSRRVQVTERTD